MGEKGKGLRPEHIKAAKRLIDQNPDVYSVRISIFSAVKLWLRKIRK